MTSTNLMPETAVREFIEKFDGPHDIETWTTLYVEELKEVKEAYLHLLKELSDLMYVSAGADIVACDSLEASNAISDRLRKEGDAFTGPELDEIIRLLMTTNTRHLQEVFNRVHASNMSKLDDDGKPIKREDGKVLKGPNYQPPDLDDIMKGGF